MEMSESGRLTCVFIQSGLFSPWQFEIQVFEYTNALKENPPKCQPQSTMFLSPVFYFVHHIQQSSFR